MCGNERRWCVGPTNSQLVRVRSKEGQLRIQAEGGDDAQVLVDQILQSLPDADVHTLTLSNEPRGGEKRASELIGSTLDALGIKYVSHYSPDTVISCMPRTSRVPKAAHARRSLTWRLPLPPAARGPGRASWRIRWTFSGKSSPARLRARATPSSAGTATRACVTTACRSSRTTRGTMPSTTSSISRSMRTCASKTLRPTRRRRRRLCRRWKRPSTRSRRRVPLASTLRGRPGCAPSASRRRLRCSANPTAWSTMWNLRTPR